MDNDQEDVILADQQEDEAQEVEEESGQDVDPEQPEGDEQSEDDSDDGEDEVVVSIGDEELEPAEDDRKAPAWVKELRKSQRKLLKENRELKAELESKAQPVQEQIKLGAKPKLEDYDYDTERFDQAVDKWYQTKLIVDEQAKKEREAQEAQQQQWRERLDAYGKAKSELKVSDYDQAEATIQDTLDITQQGVILQGAENPALVVYALGKNPKKAKELADLKDPVKFAFAVAKLEKDLKVTTRKKAPNPERTVGGNGRLSGVVSSSNLEKLREEAERTGDYSKYHDQKRRSQKSK